MSVFEDRESGSGAAVGASAESAEVASVGRRRTYLTSRNHANGADSTTDSGDHGRVSSDAQE